MDTEGDGMKWRRIPSWPAYEISDDGRVRRGGRELKQRTGNHGYTYFQPKRAQTVLIHRAMCEAFYGPPPTGAVVRHLDGTRRNHVENLRWGTPRENSRDTVLMDRTAFGVRNPKAKLNDDDVVQMRDRWARGESIASIARRFGVAYNTAECVVKRRTWWRVTA